MFDTLSILVFILVIVVAIAALIAITAVKNGTTGGREYSSTYWRDVIHAIQDSRFEYVSVDPESTYSKKTDHENVVLVESGRGRIKHKTAQNIHPRDIIRIPGNQKFTISNSGKDPLQIYVL